MTTLVTGATGFLGASLVRQLVAVGSPVRVLVRDEERRRLLGDAADKVSVVQGDIRNPDAMLKAAEGVQRVYHCAAYIGIGQRSDSALLHAVNVVGTRNVVNAALHHGIERFVATSSIAAIGRPELKKDCISEEATWSHSRFNTPYGRSKYEAELEVARGVAEGLHAVLVNPSMIFGIGRPGENTYQIVEAVRTGRFPAIPPGSTNVVDVEDVALGHQLAMEKGRPGSRYILGGENLSWVKLIRTLASAMDVDAPRRMLGPTALMAAATASEFLALITRKRPLLTRESARLTSSNTCFSDEKARAELGWDPRTFEETAERIAHHIRHAA